MTILIARYLSVAILVILIYYIYVFSLKVVSNLTGNRGGRVERKSILGKFPVFPRKISEKTSLKERFSKNKK